MAVKFSVSTKLLLIMTSTLSLVLVVALIGWLGFGQVADKQSSVIDDAVPAMVMAHKLNSINVSLFSLVSQLVSPSEQGSLRATVAGIHQQLVVLEDMTVKYKGFAPEAGMEWALQDLATNIRGNFIQQKLLAEEYLTDTQTFTTEYQAAFTSVANIYQISSSLVANANTTTAAMASSLYDLPASGEDALYSAFDRLIEVDLDHLERMYELRKVAAAMGNLLAVLPDTQTAAEVETLLIQTNHLLGTLQRRISDINDPGRRRQTEDNFAVLTDHVSNTTQNNLFIQQQQSFDLLKQHNELAEGMKALLTDFNGQVLQVSDQMSERMHKASNAARQAVAFGRNLLLLVCLLLAGAGIFFLWFYLRNKLFARIDQVSSALLAVAQGNLDVKVDYQGNDELGRLARTVGVFKDNALVRNQLEQQRELVASRLRRYQAELEEQIQSRTQDLQSLNQRLQNSAAQHQKAREEAEQANRAKTDFLATMSHEIRTPLSGILGTLRLLQTTSMEPQQDEYVGLSLQSAEALLMILNGILDYAKIEMGQLSVETVATDIYQVIATVQSIVMPIAEDKALEFNLHLAPELHDKLVLVDQAKLHQILFNLLNNAIKFTVQGNISISVIVIHDRENPWLRCQVTDTGLGIPEAKRDQLFQPFTQYDSSTARRFGGTGLGLSICQQLVHVMGGRIGITSRVIEDYSQGTCVWFELPYEFVAEQQQITDKQTDQSHYSPQYHFLVVEDNDIGRTVAEGMLKQLGHTVTCVATGQQAIDRAHETYDLILMDISMPGMDGVEATLRLRKQHQQMDVYIPIIAMSAHIFPQEVEEFLRAGMDGFIGKPLDMARVQEVITKVLNQHNAPVLITVMGSKQVLNENIVDGDVDILGRQRMVNLVKLFETSAAQQLDAIVQAHNKQQWLRIADLAHSMKSAAGSMGMEQLHQLCSQLENQARQRQASSVDLIMEDLPDLVRTSLHTLHSWQQSRSI